MLSSVFNILVKYYLSYYNYHSFAKVYICLCLYNKLFLLIPNTHLDRINIHVHIDLNHNYLLQTK